MHSRAAALPQNPADHSHSWYSNNKQWTRDASYHLEDEVSQDAHENSCPSC